MNTVEVVLLVQELEPLHVPGNVAGISHDLEVFHRSDKPPSVLIKIPGVGKRQTGAGLLKHIDRVLRGSLALWMEVSVQWAERPRS